MYVRAWTPSRSLLQPGKPRPHGLLTDEEMTGFGGETQQGIDLILGR